MRVQDRMDSYEAQYEKCKQLAAEYHGLLEAKRNIADLAEKKYQELHALYEKLNKERI